MSFLNSIRGLGRGPKKNKKDLDSSSYYNQISGSPVRRSQSPTKLSPTKQPKLSSRHSSPTRRSKPRTLIHNYPPKVDASLALAYDAKDMPLFLCESFLKTSLVKGSFKTIVQLPKYVDYGEWIALNVFEIFNNISQIYDVLVEYVTPEDYPKMNAGPNTNYLWVDSSGQSINLPACQYIDYVLSWISSKLNDQSVFPTKSGGVFPPNFIKDCKNICRQMFRILAYLYYNHFDKMIHLSLEAHYNSFFAHFISFVKEFKLVERSEMTPLLPLIEELEQQGKIL